MRIQSYGKGQDGDRYRVRLYYNKGEAKNETVVTMIKRFDSQNKELEKRGTSTI